MLSFLVNFCREHPLPAAAGSHVIPGLKCDRVVQGPEVFLHSVLFTHVYLAGSFPSRVDRGEVRPIGWGKD